jgi:hypothetical protein
VVRPYLKKKKNKIKQNKKRITKKGWGVVQSVDHEFKPSTAKTIKS